ncbi:MAG: response regulator [Candidatus Omnitrophica bacterium]|nr:response regulator [Candidatus Omnitrophota bacterium]
MHEMILMIDDEVDITKTVRFVLEDAGYDVAIAANGKEGLEKARLRNPDLIILDLKLPQLPGEAVCKEIRSDAKIAKTPIIMLTSKDSDADRVIGRVIGADFYMTKPFDLDVLSAKIVELLKNKKK